MTRFTTQSLSTTSLRDIRFKHSLLEAGPNTQNSFTSTPYILVKAEHAQPDQKHDAAFKLNKFKVCLREMQNFDGQHNKTRLHAWQLGTYKPVSLSPGFHNSEVRHTNLITL